MEKTLPSPVVLAYVKIEDVAWHFPLNMLKKMQDLLLLLLF